MKKKKICKCPCHKVEKTAGGCSICTKKHFDKEVVSPTHKGHL